MQSLNWLDLAIPVFCRILKNYLMKLVSKKPSEMLPSWLTEPSHTSTRRGLLAQLKVLLVQYPVSRSQSGAQSRARRRQPSPVADVPYQGGPISPSQPTGSDRPILDGETSMNP